MDRFPGPPDASHYFVAPGSDGSGLRLVDGGTLLGGDQGEVGPICGRVLLCVWPPAVETQLAESEMGALQL